jgi:hypothetical protein
MPVQRVPVLNPKPGEPESVWMDTCPPDSDFAKLDCDCIGPSGPCGNPYCWSCPPYALRNGIVAGTLVGTATMLFRRKGDPLVAGILVGGLVGLASWYFFSGRWWV